MRVVDSVRTAAGGLAWFVRGVMGGDAYEKYAAHQAAQHAAGAADGHPPMTEREFWRDQTDRQDCNPQGRCC